MNRSDPQARQLQDQRQATDAPRGSPEPAGGRHRATLVAALVAVLTGGACLTAADAADLIHALRHDGSLRSYVLHLPDVAAAADPATSASVPVARPLVMVLHGGGGNAWQVARMTGMNDLADRENFLVVYPNGTGPLPRALLTWNAGNCCGKALDDQVDDVGFLNTVVDHVARRYNVDLQRVYVTGMSNGAMMAYRLGCETPGRFAAIAPVAGAMNVDCRPDVPLSVIAFHGTDDQHVLYEGGEPIVKKDPHPRVDSAFQDTLAFWAAHNACNTYATDTQAEVTTEAYDGCAQGSQVVFLTLDGFGHAWPGGAHRPRGDDPTASIQASEVMWDFFRLHAR